MAWSSSAQPPATCCLLAPVSQPANEHLVAPECCVFALSLSPSSASQLACETPARDIEICVRAGRACVQPSSERDLSNQLNPLRASERASDNSIQLNSIQLNSAISLAQRLNSPTQLGLPFEPASGIIIRQQVADANHTLGAHDAIKSRLALKLQKPSTRRGQRDAQTSITTTESQPTRTPNNNNNNSRQRQQH